MNSRTTTKDQERVRRDSSLSKTEQNFLESIQNNNAVRRKEAIKEIVLKCSATSFDVYIDEIKRLSWENSKLRQKDHMIDRKGKMEKIQERIISQKNEQIRKISQEVEKTRSELKRRKQEEIVEIPVLPENTYRPRKHVTYFSMIYQNIGAKKTIDKEGKYIRLYETTAANFQDSIHQNYQDHKKLESDRIFQESQRNGRSNGDDKSRIKKLNEKVIQDKETAMKPGLGSLLRPASEPMTPMTPPERIYRELGNFASQKDSLLHPSKEEKPIRTNKTPDEEKVVDMIKNWRVREEDIPDHNDKSENKRMQSHLKKDNVAPEEVVEIIKDHRTTNKINYVQYQESTFDGSLVDKLKKVKDIFIQTSNEMEWEKINIEVVDELRKENNIRTWEEAKAWVLTKNNFFRLGQKIIGLAEQTQIFTEYTTLNDNFKQRMEIENRYQNNNKTGEKRLLLESLKKESETENNDYVDEENTSPSECWVTNLQNSQNQEIQFTMKDEIREEDEKEEEEAIASTSSPKKKSRKKKKKKGNKKN
ncbi:hypothetical protein GLOIN_2v1785337 [Rhizophagus irregularis DAOM 181602=DAOM 197198]|uniref:Uncharacterized protein n=3 Tax=Rhizophagus irregularis TaxID=588596 RepID=A0A2P4PAL8_RHIID|nr:hypothetical protein GLOIN_2v1785337 [Rhizophagus irregularis DAOM 181602=DAOM 197198]POG62428.1 hypothetical protein GLOIN_2v1785337 [Rhizophagus irregularis DAOM 181602=DAOM 197198]GBC50038.2 hypothetical protein GLOIN_2v1785337 [Rhizophagus irregularis DAOM 181602=DAOM 197198]|eukprot:XP_025169294.1 hypothetical protein GLOIN_2v1785337 [Rhizophagus irregularis DAOM 181602=DAOM 197198]